MHRGYVPSYTQATLRLAVELAHCTLTIIQYSRSRSLPSWGANLGKPLCLRPHLAPQMAGRPFPMFYYSLPIAASAVAIPTTPTKQRYPHYQKLAYGVFMMARWLSHYSQEHQIVVVNDAP